MKKISLLFLIVLFIYGLYAPLKLTPYTIPLHIKQPFSIALLADTHSSVFYYEEIFKTLHHINPDLIALVGDIIDDNTNVKKAHLFLENLQKEFPQTPKYFVSGNHEFHNLGIAEHKAIIQSYGIHILDSLNPIKHITIKDNKILLAGIDDPSITYYDSYGQRIQHWEDKNSIVWKEHYLAQYHHIQKDADTINILLAHRPEFADEYTQLPFDVILTGHAHGGQIHIPFVLEDGLYAPGQGFLPKKTGGCHSIGAQKFLIISRGLNLDLLRPRIFNPPEVVWINVQ